jgi:hypothetical protein
MDDNVWEYPFGELDDDEDMFFDRLKVKGLLTFRPQAVLSHGESG